MKQKYFYEFKGLQKKREIEFDWKFDFLEVISFLSTENVPLSTSFYCDFFVGVTFCDHFCDQADGFSQ